MAHIHFRGVTIEFPVYSSRTRAIKTAIFTRLGGRLSAHNDTITVRALRNVSLELEDGDRLGLVGHNGAGKTTLLRALSKIYPPTDGDLEVVGNVVSYTDLLLGMEPEATGWQNIIFRGVFMGLTFSGAKALAPSIAEFSELGEYLDLPVRTYSTGMLLRLAFAIATAVEPDIIILDEMIGVGDAQFLKKTQERMTDLLERARILVLASHSMEIVRNFCNKAIWLDRGEIRMQGTVWEVLAAYSACQSTGAATVT